MSAPTSARPPAGSGAAGPGAGVLRRLGMPPGAGMARMLMERNARTLRYFWPTIASGFFEPVFYLFSLGVGIGGLVGTVDAGGGRTVEYATFLAPALLAASAMNGAVFDTTGNVFFKLKYARLYDSVLSTPLGPRDVAVAEVGWALLRGSAYSAAFLVVMALAGAVSSWWALLCLPAAVLIGLAFGGLGLAATTYMRSWQDLDLVQLAVLPMFLFSATFYPLETYPGVLQWVVQATPLYHGVALARDLALGMPDAGTVGHAAYLVLVGLAGMVIAARRLERTLLS